MELNLVISLIALLFSVLTMVYTITREQMSVKAKFMDDLLNIDNLIIQHPVLDYIFYEETDLKAKKFSEDDLTKLEVFCYKFLDLLDFMDLRYNFEASNDPTIGISKIIKRGSYQGEWLNYFSKSFHKGTLGYRIMINILENVDTTGEYSSSFSNFAIALLNYQVIHQKD